MKTLRRGATLTLGSLALLVAVGCSESSGPELIEETTLNDDVAMMAAQAAIDDVGEMRLGSALGIPAETSPGGVSEELSRSRTVTFYDAAGDEMDAFDPLATASIRQVLDVEGIRETPHWEASMARHRDMTVSGLEGEETERVWNGTGTDDVSRMRFEDDRSYEMDGEATIDEVVEGVPRSDHPWPLSGTITRHLVVTIVNGPNGDETRERSAVLTFDGSRYATLEVDGEVYEVDLADREGRRPRRKGK